MLAVRAYALHYDVAGKDHPVTLRRLVAAVSGKVAVFDPLVDRVPAVLSL
jgi:hypothetical protein